MKSVKAEVWPRILGGTKQVKDKGHKGHIIAELEKCHPGGNGEEELPHYHPSYYGKEWMF